MVAGKPKLSCEAQFKLAIMRTIDEDLSLRFDTLVQAAEYAGVEPMRLSRIRSGRYEYFSVKWLFRLAEVAKVRIRISVDPVNR